MIKQPSYDDLLNSATKALSRINQLENALYQISDLSIAGTWPARGMGSIARKALGPSGERRHQKMLNEIANEY